MLNKHTCDVYTSILIDELRPAMGCTEPIAIAYASSIISHALGAAPSSLKVGLSGNIIKNAKSVVITFATSPDNIEVVAGTLYGKITPEGVWPVSYHA